jgi:endogenous inhibitor of DNA gyrase (YacG/DUF329 family)
MTMKKPLLCPTCRKPVQATNEDFPFCSDRCRLIDQDIQLQQERALNDDPNHPEKNWKN